MEAPDHTFWDELGVAWRATVPDDGLFRSRLERRLRLQAMVSTAAAVATAVAGVVGLSLGSWTLWIGWSNGFWHFVIRGAALVAAAIFALLAASVLRTSREAVSLRESLQLLVAKTERLVRAADLLVASVAVIGLGGLVGYVIRTLGRRPVFVSPIEDLLGLAVLALALLWFRWDQSRSLEAARYVCRNFDTSADHPGESK